MQSLQNVNEPKELSFYTNSRQNEWHDFLKKSKNHAFRPILTIYGHFCLMGIFSKKSDSATKNYIWLRLGLSHLRDNKFKHGFLDSLNLICSYGLDVETTCPYLLHCPNFTNGRSILLNIVSTINESSSTSSDPSAVKLLLNGDESLDLETNTLIWNATAHFILSSKRFEGPLI